MAAAPYDDILKRAQDELTPEELHRLVIELAQHAGRKNGEKHYTLLDLEGLGKEIWEGVHPDAYVSKERESWDG